jgi:DNA repair protein RadC
MGEKFTTSELAALRTELIQGGLDSLQTAELLQVFLMGHGYGASQEAALDAAARVGGDGYSLEAIQMELDKLALVQ